MGYLGVFMAIGQGIHPLIGGVSSEKVSWRVCFALHTKLVSYLMIPVVFLGHSAYRRSRNRNRFVLITTEEGRGGHETASLSALVLRAILQQYVQHRKLKAIDYFSSLL